MTYPSFQPAAATARRAPIRRWVATWIALVTGTTVVGTLGYVAMLGWSLDDSLYMTVISLTTVGYKEVRELDTLGRAWSMLVTLAGVGIIFGTVGFVAETFVAEALSGRKQRRRMADSIASLRGHFIVCGFGRVGATVTRELEKAGLEVVVIDSLPASVQLAEGGGHYVVPGDATRDDVLRAAGVARARGLITSVDSDAQNVFVTLSARALNADLLIIARANEAGSESKLRQAGADRVVSPYTRAGRQIAAFATRPRVADFIDFALSHGELSFSIEEVEVAPDGPLAGSTIGALGARGIHVMALVGRGPNQFETTPASDRALEPGDRLIVSGTVEALREVQPGS